MVVVPEVRGSKRNKEGVRVEKCTREMVSVKKD